MNILQQLDLFLEPLAATFVLVLLTVILLFWYSSKKCTYWKKRGIPYVKPFPILGEAYEILRKPVHDIELDRYKKCGRIYGHYAGNGPILSLAEPDILRNIFVKDFHVFTGRRPFKFGDKITDSMVSVLRGEDWKRVRNIITPTFTTGKLKQMMNIFNECSKSLVQNFKKAVDRGEPVDAKNLYGAFTMDIIASSAFSTKIDSHNDPNNTFVQTARNAFTRSIDWKIVLFTMFPVLMKLFRFDVFARSGLEFFETVTLQIIEERKKTGQKRNDFLQLLLDTNDELSKEGKLDLNEKDDGIAENYGNESSDHILKHTALAKKTLSQDEVVAQCVVSFLAGYDTTASTLSFASYCLALNPDVQEKLIKELDEALGENKGDLTYEAIQSMKYLDNVISETLRIYPPAFRLERAADEDYKLEDIGLDIPKGMIISIPVYAMHRDPKLFPDPEKFDPDRFSAEERAKRNQYAYLPFGAGPRNCIGMRFALMEVKVCLAHVLSNFRIKKCSETKVPLDFFPGQGLLQPKEIKVLLEVRKGTM